MPKPHLKVVDLTEANRALRQYCDHHKITFDLSWMQLIYQFHINDTMREARGESLQSHGVNALIMKHFGRPIHIVNVGHILNQHISRRACHFPYNEWRITTHPLFDDQLWITNKDPVHVKSNALNWEDYRQDPLPIPPSTRRPLSICFIRGFEDGGSRKGRAPYLE